MKSTPDNLFHYTTINSLGFILKNHNIRFNNLCDMDDIDEGIYSNLKWGKYFFVSSWTGEERESIEMWKMYSNDMNGVRIKLRTYPFKEYDIRKTPRSPEHEIMKSLIPFEMIYNKNFTFAKYRQQEILHKVEYKDICTVDSVRSSTPSIKHGFGSFEMDISKIGKIKNEYWGFQKEWRYMLFVAPIPGNLNPLTHEEINEKIENMEKIPDLPFKDYYLNIEDKAYDEMEILIGPKTNDIDIKIVELLVKEYNPSARITISCLRERIR